MGVLSEIKSLGVKHITLFVFVFLGIVATGFLIIFQFRPELIEKYDIFKIMLLALGLTLPLALINMLLIFFQVKNKYDPFVTCCTALVMNVIVVYPPLLVCHFFSYRLKGFLVMVAVLEGLWLIGGFIKPTKAN